MSSSKNLEYKKTSFLNKSNSAFIEEMYLKYIDVTKKMQELSKVLDTVYWYDRKVFEIISSGVTIAELSRKTNITYASLYNTYRNVKNIIKQNIEWD